MAPSSPLVSFRAGMPVEPAGWAWVGRADQLDRMPLPAGIARAGMNARTSLAKVANKADLTSKLA